jgi:hypothetical protein
MGRDAPSGDDPAVTLKLTHYPDVPAIYRVTPRAPYSYGCRREGYPQVQGKPIDAPWDGGIDVRLGDREGCSPFEF